jgi:hypothetical protein
VSRINWAYLHEKIWARPMTTLPEDFGVSGHGLAKSASALDVPAPPWGHWAKLQNRALPTLVAALAYFDVDWPARVKCARLGLLAVKPVAGEHHGSTRE